MAHITGGGLPENLPRCIPKGLNVKLNYNSWQLPEIFQKIMLAGEIPQEEMINVFNLGIGYCIVTSPNNEENILFIVRRCYDTITNTKIKNINHLFLWYLTC